MQKKRKETDPTDKLVCASFANNYDCDGTGSSCPTAQSKSNTELARIDKNNSKLLF